MKALILAILLPLAATAQTLRDYPECQEGRPAGPLDHYEELTLGERTDDAAAWERLSATLAGAGNLWASWVSTNWKGRMHNAPLFQNLRDTLLVCWAGETLSAQALLAAPWGSQRLIPELAAESRTAAGIKARASFVRYVATTAYQQCGYPSPDLPAWLTPDVIDFPSAPLALGREEVRPVWCRLDIPGSMAPGDYHFRLHLTAEHKAGKAGRARGEAGDVTPTLRLTLRVLPRRLPPATEWRFITNFWQQPYSVARYHGLGRWSPEHYAALRPYLRELARSGQKVISAILFYEPWGEQSNDKFSPMVDTRLRTDGTWTYDYTVFDRWVRLCQECGIGGTRHGKWQGQINCYTMIPWGLQFRYFDEASSSYKTLTTKTGTQEYRDLWTAFLRSFKAHLREQGWLESTCIAVDERGLDAMLDAHHILQEVAPELKLSLAGSFHPELSDKVWDYTIAYSERFPADTLRARHERGWHSLCYTCCAEARPNTFSNSEPAEASFLPLFAISNHFDGYLRWSWMDWNDHPLTDTRYRMFAPGDTYCVYPGPRSSIRYERYIDGLQLAEKARLLMEDPSTPPQQRARITSALEAISTGLLPTRHTARERVEQLRSAVNLSF